MEWWEGQGFHFHPVFLNKWWPIVMWLIKLYFTICDKLNSKSSIYRMSLKKILQQNVDNFFLNRKNFINRQFIKQEVKGIVGSYNECGQLTNA
jgi:hypothetical protein